MTPLELKALTDLLMVSDPWPLTDKDKTVMIRLANTEAIACGYTDWIDAYHRLAHETL